MSRPPYPLPARSTGEEQSGDLKSLEYLPLWYADLVGLQQELAASILGRPAPEQEPAEPDTAYTFMELSALVAHILGVYQRSYAGEAYISTAQAASSLVRHALRLAYEPDPGLAANGYVVLFAKSGVSGTVPAGLALASVPLGEQKAQDYETLDDTVVDSALNSLEPLNAKRAVIVEAGNRELPLEGVGLGLDTGDLIALVGPHWQGFVIKELREVADEGVTFVSLDAGVTREIRPDNVLDDPPRILAGPSRTLRPFGVAADPALYPPRLIRNAGGPPAPALFRSRAGGALGARRSNSGRFSRPTGDVIGEGASRGPGAGASSAADAEPSLWFSVQRADRGSYVDTDVYLSEQVSDPLKDAYIVRRDGAMTRVLRVTDEVVAGVTLYREALETLTTHRVVVKPQSGGGFETQLVEESKTQTSRSHVSGTVTAIQVTDREGRAVRRVDHTFPAEWLTGWTIEASLALTEPNPEELREPLELPGQLSSLTPGRPLAFINRSETVAQVVVVRKAEINAAANKTRIWWDATSVGRPPERGWKLADLKIFGNVARVSHGRTVDQLLGGSDGVTPFQRFALKESPVTVLPGVGGGEPEIAVRVNDVLWQRVHDFYDSGPDDPHYRTETDETGVTTVVFGDGRTGAVPPSGNKNIRASYRVGLGRGADVDSARLSRLKLAHPLLARATNVTPVGGGAEPAGPEEIRAQSTRWIRTFDRAVSVSDHADLALMMPGIARSAARWDQARGVVLVVATSSGESPPAMPAVRAFLDARRDVSVPLELRGPTPKELRIDVDIVPDPAYLVELVKADVRAALHGESEEISGMFTFPSRNLGQAAYLSELYELLEAVPGVIGVRIAVLARRGSAGVEEMIPASVEEWLRLAPQDLTVTVDGAAT